MEVARASAAFDALPNPRDLPPLDIDEHDTTPPHGEALEPAPVEEYSDASGFSEEPVAESEVVDETVGILATPEQLIVDDDGQRLAGRSSSAPFGRSAKSAGSRPSTNTSEDMSLPKT